MKRKFIYALAWTILVASVTLSYLHFPVITGMIINAILVALLIYRQTQKKDSSRREAEAFLKDNDYLRARLRGFQQYATSVVYAGERKYLVQQANGKFTAAWLPNVQ